MKINQEDYRSKTKIYYLPEIELDFCQKLVDYFWGQNSISEVEIELVKKTNTRKIKVFKLTYQDKIYYLKKYSYQRITKKVENNILRRPEGVRNFKVAKQLLAAKINTAKPIFSATKRKKIFRDSLYCTEQAKGEELSEYIKENNLTGNQLVLKSLARFWAKFINNNFLHQDPGLSNLFISHKQSEIEFSLIDIDNIYKLPVFIKPLAVHNLARVIAKTYISLFKHNKNKTLLKRADLELLLKEFIKYSKVEFDFERLRDKIEKLIIKKIKAKKWQEIIDSSQLLMETDNNL